MLKQFLRFRAYVVLAVAMVVAYLTVQSATQSVQVVAAAKDLVFFDKNMTHPTNMAVACFAC